MIEKPLERSKEKEKKFFFFFTIENYSALPIIEVTLHIFFLLRESVQILPGRQHTNHTV